MTEKYIPCPKPENKAKGDEFLPAYCAKCRDREDCKAWRKP